MMKNKYIVYAKPRAMPHWAMLIDWLISPKVLIIVLIDWCLPRYECGMLDILVASGLNVYPFLVSRLVAK